ASTHNTIKGNIFDITQKEYGTIVGYAHADSIPAGDQGVFLSKKSHNNSVTANTIKTNAEWPVLIDYDSVQNNVTNNSLQGKKYFGDKAVKNESKALIQNNYLYPIKCSAKNVDGQVGGKITLVAYMSSRTKDVSNVTATFRLGDTTVGKSKITDGKATISYTIPTYWRAANYDIIVVMGGTNFQNSTARATATITKNQTKTVITANKVLGTPGSTVQMNATVKDNLGNNMNGKVDFILNGTKLATKTLTDGKVSHSYKIPANSPITTIPLVIKYYGNDQFAESNISTILGVQNTVVASVYYSNATIGSPITFKAKFTQNGKALTSGKVAVKINGLTIGTTNIVNGIATYNYVVPVGYSVFQKHVVQFVYGGTDTLTSARAEREFDVYPMKTVIQLNKTTAKVGQNITMKVRITNESLTHNAVSGKVALKIKGVTVKDANGNPIVAVPQKGIVTIKIPITKSLIGKNTITVTYSGNNRLTGARVDFKDILVVTG
ncbi:MAG: Ig-like domain repeat protein, partial [Methanosphaera sp.]|nr:Ig-like domain repeat protein [Methanosphaera sp.]